MKEMRRPPPVKCTDVYVRDTNVCANILEIESDAEELQRTFLWNFHKDSRCRGTSRGKKGRHRQTGGRRYTWSCSSQLRKRVNCRCCCRETGTLSCIHTHVLRWVLRVVFITCTNCLFYVKKRIQTTFFLSFFTRLFTHQNFSKSISLSLCVCP
jgi:hypothetical protein